MESEPFLVKYMASRQSGTAQSSRSYSNGVYGLGSAHELPPSDTSTDEEMLDIASDSSQVHNMDAQLYTDKSQGKLVFSFGINENNISWLFFLYFFIHIFNVSVSMFTSKNMVFSLEETWQLLFEILKFTPTLNLYTVIRA